MDNITDFKNDTSDMVQPNIDDSNLISESNGSQEILLGQQKIAGSLIAANFDLLLVQTDDSEVNHQLDATLKDEIVPLMDCLCESVQNNSTLLNFADGALDDNLLYKEGDAIMYPAIGQSSNDKCQVSELVFDESSKIILKPQTEEDISTKWQAEKSLLEKTIAMKNAAFEKYESKSIQLETEMEKLLMKLMETNELLADKTEEVKNLKSKLESKETEIKSMKFDISQALIKIVELKERLEEEQLVVGIVRNEKEKALDEVAKLHDELNKQLAKCKKLETQCALTSNELNKFQQVEGNEELPSKRSKVATVKDQENIAPTINFSGLNVMHSYPQMNGTGPFYKCDIDSENQRNVYPSHQRNFNFYNESTITIGQRKRNQQENKDSDNENDGKSSTQAVPKNAPFLRVGLSRKSRILRPLHDSTNN